MHLLLEDEPIAAARISADEIKIELASALYLRGRLTLGQAARLANVSHWQMQQALAVRGISINYDEAELDADSQQLNRSASLAFCCWQSRKDLFQKSALF